LVHAASRKKGGIISRPFPLRGELLDILTALLPVPFPGKRFFRAPLLARLQVKGVSFDLLNNVFLLNLALEAAESGL
jgi:hypothetical protein